MQRSARSTVGVLLCSVAALTIATPARESAAQAWSYPAFQTPRVTARELNFGLADADDGGTTLLFQWREGYATRSQLSLDLGFVDYSNDELFFIGGQFASQLTTSSASMPFDLMLTAGVNLATSDPTTVFRIPIGVSAGRRFPLEGMMAITPFVHPRLSIDRVSVDRGPGREDFSDTEINIVFDLGGSFEFSPSFAIRLAGSLGGDFLEDSFGVSLAWTPGGSRTPVARPPRRG